MTTTDVAAHLNIPSPTVGQTTELGGFLSAADQHVVDEFGPVLSLARTEKCLRVRTDGVLWFRHYPVLSVTTATRTGVVYSTGFTIGRLGRVTSTDFDYGDRWDVSYTSGWVTFPASLRLAILEDIRGLYQGGQLGPPGAIAAFGMDSQEPARRPVGMWPRTDAWIATNQDDGVG